MMMVLFWPQQGEWHSGFPSSRFPLQNRSDLLLKLSRSPMRRVAEFPLRWWVAFWCQHQNGQGRSTFFSRTTLVVRGRAISGFDREPSNATKGCSKNCIPRLLNNCQQKEVLLKNLLLPKSYFQKVCRRFMALLHLEKNRSSKKEDIFGVFATLWMDIISRARRSVCAMYLGLLYAHGVCVLWAIAAFIS